MRKRPDPRLIATILSVHGIITAATWRDLGHRDADEVRGPKWLWRGWSALNTTGSAAYWLFGRR